MSRLLLVYLLGLKYCLGAQQFDTRSSYSKCILYYDFSRDSSQRVPSSPFTQNTFNGNIIDNSYLDIIDENVVIGSNSDQSFDEYTVVFDVSFPSINNIRLGGYFWGSDSTQDINTGGYNGKQYHFKLGDGTNNKLGIENFQEGPYSFDNSEQISTDTRYLISYVITSTKADLYIDGIYKDTQSLSNGGIYNPYYIKLGGVGHANRPQQNMKVYQYAFYNRALTTRELSDLQASPVCTFLAIDQYLTLCSEEFPNTNAQVDTNDAAISSLDQKVDSNAATDNTARNSLRDDIVALIANLQSEIDDNTEIDAAATNNLQSQIDDINTHLNALTNVPMSAQSIYSINNDDNLFGVNNSNQSLIILALIIFNVLFITIICVLCYVKNQDNNSRARKRIHFIDSDAEQQALK